DLAAVQPTRPIAAAAAALAHDRKRPRTGAPNRRSLVSFGRMSTATAAKPCPNCSAPTTGRYCSECGAAVTDAICAGCRSLLSPGARFCHRCGTAVGTAPNASTESRVTASSVLPWSVAAIALLALVALLAGQRFGGTRPAPAAETPPA